MDKIILFVVLALVSATFAHPQPQRQFCIFGGPTDAPTLRNVNFIENYVTGSCLKQENYGFNSLQPITLDTCSWSNRFPSKQHLFKIENHNGGSLIKSTLLQTVFNNRCLVAPTGSLASNICIPKSDEQTWVFNIVDRRRNLYTIMKKSNRKCLQVVSPKREKHVIETYCNSKDQTQLWRICSSTR